MKKTYPSYRKKGTNWIYESLKAKEKKVFDDFMNFLGTTAGERKMGDYKMYFLQFIDIIEKPIYNLKPQDIVDFWALVNHDTIRETHTKNSIKTTIKRFCKWYYKDDLEMRDTIEGLHKKNIIVNTKKINKQTLLTEEDIDKLLRAAETLKQKAQIITLYVSGARPHELRQAKWKDIDWDKKTIHLYSTKTEKAREVPIHDAILSLKRWKAEFMFPNVSEEDYIFPSSENRNKPIGEYMFGYWIRAVGKKAGLKKHIYSYIFRHSRISYLKEKGVEEDDRKIFAGHSANSKMQSVYTHIDNEDMIHTIISKLAPTEELTEKEKDKIKQLEKEIEKMRTEQSKTARGIAEKMYELNSIVIALGKQLQMK